MGECDPVSSTNKANAYVWHGPYLSRLRIKKVSYGLVRGRRCRKLANENTKVVLVLISFHGGVRGAFIAAVVVVAGATMVVVMLLVGFVLTILLREALDIVRESLQVCFYCICFRLDAGHRLRSFFGHFGQSRYLFGHALELQPTSISSC